MSYQIRINPEAQKEIKALPGHVRAQVRQFTKELTNNPHPPGSKELRGKPGVYRIWIAQRWRLVYQVYNDVLLILVLRVRLKSQIDYDSIPDAESDEGEGNPT